MNSSVDEKRECAKKIMHAIGELPDDMISKALERRCVYRRR